MTYESAPNDRKLGQKMQKLNEIFEEIIDPQRSNSTRHDLNEMLAIALMTVPTGSKHVPTWPISPSAGWVFSAISWI